jgi:succinate-semialdehyde dehydrogenase/glutarate-semialdehyde dehydrogenase
VTVGDQLPTMAYGPVVGGIEHPGEGVIEVVNPATEEVIAGIADATVAEALAAVDVAQQAFCTWRETSPRQRAEVLRSAFGLIIAHVEPLARLIVLENGRHLPTRRDRVRRRVLPLVLRGSGAA